MYLNFWLKKIKFYLKAIQRLVELEFGDYLLLLVLLKSPILGFVYFKFIHKSHAEKGVKSLPESVVSEN
jgi:hypothetical protein